MNYTEKNKLLDKISLIGLMMIFVEIFLYGVDYCFTKRFDIIATMPKAMIVFGVVFLAISILLFVMVYKKGKKNFTIFAVEFLVLALLCPFITYWYYPKFYGLSTNGLHTINHQVLWVIVFVYYICRLAYSIFDAIKNSNSRKLKKRKA